MTVLYITSYLFYCVLSLSAIFLYTDKACVSSPKRKKSKTLKI